MPKLVPRFGNVPKCAASIADFTPKTGLPSYSTSITFFATKHGGSDDLRNLCLSCGYCNLAKGPNLGGLLEDRIVPLFHPRRQTWSRHFYWDGPLLVGKTLCGKATINVLNINEPRRIRLRQILIDEGRFPPDD